MKQLLLFLLIISAIGCSETEKSNKDDSFTPAIVQDSGLTTEPPFDTVVKQDVRREGDKYLLQTYVLTSKYDYVVDRDCNNKHKNGWNTGMYSTYAPFDKVICGDFKYIITNKKRMYDEAWAFIAREKAIADSIKMIEAVPIEKDTSFNVALGYNDCVDCPKENIVHLKRDALERLAKEFGIPDTTVINNNAMIGHDPARQRVFKYTVEFRDKSGAHVVLLDDMKDINSVNITGEMKITKNY